MPMDVKSVWMWICTHDYFLVVNDKTLLVLSCSFTSVGGINIQYIYIYKREKGKVGKVYDRELTARQ